MAIALAYIQYIKSLGSFFMKEIPIFKIVKDHVTLKTWVMASDNNIFKYNKIENQKIHNICFFG